MVSSAPALFLRSCGADTYDPFALAALGMVMGLEEPKRGVVSILMARGARIDILGILAWNMQLGQWGSYEDGECPGKEVEHKLPIMHRGVRCQHGGSGLLEAYSHCDGNELKHVPFRDASNMLGKPPVHLEEARVPP